MGQTGSDALAQDLALKLGKHGEQASHGAAGGRGQIKRFGQRNETHAEMLQLLKCRNEIRDGPAPAIQAPHQHDIDFTSCCASE
jgi:hypothetical protein